MHGDTIEDLRKEIIHREDTEQTALSLAELIVKKGDEKWADDLLEGLGPWAMVQLADMANFFETARKFVLHLTSTLHRSITHVSQLL